MRSSLLVIALVVLTTGCASHTYIDYKNFRSIGLSHKAHGLKNVGFVRSEDCGWTLFHQHLSAPPSFEDALEGAASLKNQSFKDTVRENYSSRSRVVKTKVKMLTNIQTREEGWSLYFIGRKCLKFSAIAYQ